ncbi:MAG: MFS transporter, partial [Burkholderiales bacterium]
ALGLIEGIAEATGSLLKLFSGVLVDRRGTAKGWIVGGYGLAALGRPLLALATSWPVVLTLRFADRVGKGLRSSPRDALLASSVGAHRRGLAFGLHRAMDNAGAVIGPLLAAALLASGMAIRDILLWTLVPGLVTVALALAVREPARPRTEHRAPFSWTLAGFPLAFRRYLVVLALFTLGNSSNMFLLLRAREIGAAEAEVPLLWALTSVVAMLASTPLAALSDRVGRLRLILGGWAVYAIVYLLLGLVTAGPVLLWCLFALYGLFLAATEGAEKALVADLAPPALVGTAYGWFNVTTGLMLLPASIVFGWFWQSFGVAAAFAFAAGCAVLAAILLARWVGGGDPGRRT